MKEMENANATITKIMEIARSGAMEWILSSPLSNPAMDAHECLHGDFYVTVLCANVENRGRVTEACVVDMTTQTLVRLPKDAAKELYGVALEFEKKQRSTQDFDPSRN